MLKTIAYFELKTWAKSFSSYLYFGFFFAFTFVAFVGNAGFFDVENAAATNVRIVNSPYEIDYMMNYLNKVFLFLIPAIIGATFYKDIKHNVHNVLFSYPLKKLDYLIGKYIGSLAVVILITFSVGLAIYGGQLLPNLHASKIGPIQDIAIIQTYALNVIPNIIIHGSIVFGIVILTRNIYACFVYILMIFLFQIIIENGFTNHPFLIALLDPLGQNTTQYITRNWTLLEQNTLMIPIDKIIIQNRGIWLITSAIILFFSGYKFRLEQEAPINLELAGKRKKPINQAQISATSYPVEVSIETGWRRKIKNCWAVSQFDFRFIMTSWLFYIILFGALAAMILVSAKITNLTEIAFLPVTSIMISAPMTFFSIFVMLLTFLYSGMLVHREKSAKVDQLIDASSVSTISLISGKFLAILKMQAILLAMVMIAGVSLQLFNDFSDIKFSLYLSHLFGLVWPSLVIWAMVSMFIHAIMPNIYFGIFILIAGWIGTSSLPQAGIDHPLLFFNPSPVVPISEMGGYDFTLKKVRLLQKFWFAFSGIFLLIGGLLWKRGLSYDLKEKWTTVKKRWGIEVKIVTVLLFSLMVFYGFTIFQEEKKIKYDQSFLDQAYENYIHNFSSYENMTQPKITGVYLNIELYPEEYSFQLEGEYELTNKTEADIDTLFLRGGFDETTTFELEEPYEIIALDSIMQVSVIKLRNPIRPGEVEKITFYTRNKENSIFEKNSSVLKNGTFLKDDILPRIGYQTMSETLLPTDAKARFKSYNLVHADLVDFECILSTSGNQRAITVGELINSWKENERYYFHYKAKSKVKFTFGFNSGEFLKVEEEVEGKQIELFYHKGHDYNLQSLEEGLRAAIEYNTEYFSEYQHQTAKIIEFPITYGTFATTFSNTMPTSEARFIANTKIENDKIDIAFYVAAHELTHQWWGNQVLPADAQGSRMLTESITEYITLQIYKRKYGKEKAEMFLEKQRERYLAGRKRDSGKEVPLSYVKSNQSYIAYGKGAVVFNALSQRIGEDSLNAMLKNFLDVYQFQEEVYPTSIDLINVLKEHIPETIVSDYFEHIVLSDHKIATADWKEIENGRYEVLLSIDFDEKYVENDIFPLPLKKEKFIVEIGIYDKDGNLIKLQTLTGNGKENEFKITVDDIPAKVILDPRMLCLDLSIDNNQILF